MASDGGHDPLANFPRFADPRPEDLGPHLRATTLAHRPSRSPLGPWPLGGHVVRYPAIINPWEGGMWRDVVALTLGALLLGAAILANVTDGPMWEHRGSWVTRASIGR